MGRSQVTKLSHNWTSKLRPWCHSHDQTQWCAIKINPVLDWLQAVPYSRDYKQKYDYFRKKLKKPVSLRHAAGPPVSLSRLTINYVPWRPTSRTALRWRSGGMPSWRTRTDASCRWPGPTCWKHVCGWSLRGRRALTMEGWPGSGSSSCRRRCSTRTTDCLNTLLRESLF